jgi:predicted PurR-regulated permease PerM
VETIVDVTPDAADQQPIRVAPPTPERVIVTPVPPVRVAEDDAIATAAGVDERPAGGLTPVTLLLTAALGYLLFKIQIVIILLIAGILLATAIGGPVEYLHKRRNIGRGPAILLIYLAILVGLGSLFYALIPPVAREATNFAQAVPSLIENWRGQMVASGNPVLRTAGGRLTDALNGAGSGTPLPTGLAFGVVQGVGGALVTLFSLFLIAFYWITEKPLIKRAVVTLFRPNQRRRTLRLWSEVEVKLGAWIRGQLILMVVIGTLATVAYGLMGLTFWLVLGVIAGLTEAIPNIGPALGAIPAVLVALTLGWQYALAVVAFVVVLQLLENAVLVPRIMRGTVGLTPLTIILAILAGSEFNGVVGALLAIPVAGAIQVILSDLLREKRRRDAAVSRATPPRGFGRWPLLRARRARGGARGATVVPAGDRTTDP